MSKKILLVEDDRWLAEAMQDSLKNLNQKFRIEHVADALAAMKKLNVTKYDLLVIDLFLPGASGIQILHELKSYHDTFDTPVIICSAHADQLKLDSLSAYGVVKILDKASLTPAKFREILLKL